MITTQRGARRRIIIAVAAAAAIGLTGTGAYAVGHHNGETDQSAPWLGSACAVYPRPADPHHIIGDNWPDAAWCGSAQVGEAYSAAYGSAGHPADQAPGAATAQAMVAAATARATAQAQIIDAVAGADTDPAGARRQVVAIKADLDRRLAELGATG